MRENWFLRRNVHIIIQYSFLELYTGVYSFLSIHFPVESLGDKLARDKPGRRVSEDKDAVIFSEISQLKDYYLPFSWLKFSINFDHTSELACSPTLQIREERLIVSVIKYSKRF